MSTARAGSKPGFPIGWVLLFAILTAYALEDLKAAWLGALAGYLFGRQLALEHELAALRAQVERILARLARAESTQGATATAASAAASSGQPRTASNLDDASPIGDTRDASGTASASVAAPAASSSSSPSIGIEAPVQPQPAIRIPPPAPRSDGWQPVAPPPPARRMPGSFDAIEAWLNRGNPLARLGVLITFFGAVYLIKYAAEEGWLPIEWRLAGLALGALAMVAIGWRLRDKTAVYALTLQGGGLALLYLTVLAAFRFYDLLPSSTALSLLVIVAASSSLLAVRQNALALAVIGFSGGFVAPLLIGGHGSHIALFGYYTVLNLGIFAIAAYRAWSVLNLLGFVFTFVITALWRATAYQPDLFASTEFFLLLFFVLYVAVTVLNAGQGEDDALRERTKTVSGTLTFGLPAVVLSLQATLVRDFEYGLAWSALGFGLFYLGLAAALHAAARERLRIPRQAFLALGVVLLTLAVPLRYDDHATAATWALEGAGAVWLGLRQQQRRARFFGVLIQLLAGGSLVLGLRDAVDPGAWFAAGVPGALLLALAGGLSAVWLHRDAAQLENYENGIDRAAAFWSLGWWLYAGLAQIDHIATPYGTGFNLLFVAATALLLERAGARLAWAWLRGLAAGLVALFAAIASGDALLRHPFAAGGFFGWPALLVAHYALLWRRDRAVPDDDAEALIPGALHVAGYWLLVLLVSRELAWQIDRTRSEDWVALAWGIAPALLMLPLAQRWPRWPVMRHETSYRLVAAAPVAAGLLLWILVNSLFDAGDAAPWPTLPVLNPLDVTVAGVASVLALWWQSVAPGLRGSIAVSKAWLLPAIVSLVIFIWLNSALVRGLHYGVGSPLGFYGIRYSALVQAAFSIFWSALGFGAMLFASRRHLREVWIAGAALMVIVALKLFLIDTAGTGTLARIVGFLIVGALMLVTGYLAPLPPEPRATRRAGDTSPEPDR